METINVVHIVLKQDLASQSSLCSLGKAPTLEH